MHNRDSITKRKKEAEEKIIGTYEAQFQSYAAQNWPISAAVVELEKRMKADLESTDKILKLVASQYLATKQRLAKYEAQFQAYGQQKWPIMAGLKALQKDMQLDLESNDKTIRETARWYLASKYKIAADHHAGQAAWFSSKATWFANRAANIVSSPPVDPLIALKQILQLIYNNGTITPNRENIEKLKSVSLNDEVLDLIRAGLMLREGQEKKPQEFAMKLIDSGAYDALFSRKEINLHVPMNELSRAALYAKLIKYTLPPEKNDLINLFANKNSAQDSVATVSNAATLTLGK
jgi:hypothetical protein